MDFSDLNINTPLRNAIEDLGFVYPTPIQTKCFPVIMSGKDVVGVAQTGTGKTFAYLLPILRQLKYSEQKKPRVIIVVPTRELVLQVVGEINKLSKYMTLRTVGVYGGANINTQKQLIHNGLDILVATPGRLMDLYMTGILRFKDVQKLVIDEVDEMLKQGFHRQIEAILDVLPKKHQNLMFSATLTTEVEQLIDNYFYNPEKIIIAQHGTPIDKINQVVYYVPNFFTKVNLLKHLLKNDDNIEKLLVFVATKKLADRLEEQLVSEFEADSIGVIHSNKSQNQRFSVVRKFADNEIKMLIATDIIARGLDISDVSHVLNFDMPNELGDYIHRIGRTGRAGKDGESISFVNEAEQEYLKAIEQLMKKSMTLVEIPEDVEISAVFTDEERPDLGDKQYVKTATIKHSKGAFHQKKAKNNKVQSGSPRFKKAKYKKSGKKNKK